MDEGLERFLEPLAATRAAALREIAAGRKDSHWMWWVFPQLAGLGRSPIAARYGLRGAGEAAAFLAHPELGPGLLAAARAMLGLRGQAAEAVLGPVDAAKLRSCATLFAALPGAPPEFEAILDAFFDGRPDPLTLARLEGTGG